MLNVLIVKT